MISKIKLRGISRVPSDRTNEDGGCAESINVHIDEGEIVPILRPRVVRDNGIDDTGNYCIVHVHKGATYTCFLGYWPAGHKIKLFLPDGSTDQVFDLQAGETYRDATSVGNILVVVTDRRKLHFRARIDEQASTLSYQALGERVPMPSVNVTPTDVLTRPAQESDIDGQFYYVGLISLSPEASVIAQDQTTYEFFDAGLSSPGVIPERDADIKKVNAALWDGVAVLKNRNRALGYYCTPVMVKYALKLYDGSYVNASVPILVSGRPEHKGFDMVAIKSGILSAQTVEHLTSADNIYKVQVGISQWTGVEDWADMVQGLDVFVSPDIDDVPMRADFRSAVSKSGGDAASFVYKGQTGDEVKDFDKALTETGNFYKVASFSMEELQASGITKTLDSLSNDELVLKDRLPDITDSAAISPLEGITSYNNRLMLFGIKGVMPEGLNAMNAQVGVGSTSTKYVGIYYYVRDGQGVPHVVKGFEGYIYYERCRGFIAYPKTGCYKAEIYVASGSSGPYTQKYTIPMKDMPLLNASYSFMGLTAGILSPTPETVNIPVSTGIATNPEYTLPNTLALSVADNPFSFSLIDRKSFAGKVFSAAAITIALSDGQMGAFDLYIFTDYGIYFIKLNETGGFGPSNPNPITRDVAIPGTILEIDQAVVFATDRGAMIIQGGNVACISPHMNGEVFMTPAQAANIPHFDSDFWPADYVDSRSHVDFIKTARPVWDYAGRRLIYFSTADGGAFYTYIYMVDQQTWHKMELEGAYVFERALNSYPDAWVSVYDAGAMRVLNYSTPLASLAEDEEAMPGLIVTRALNFGQNDVYKTINDVHLRGSFEKLHVRYAIQASNDGAVWFTLHSFHGPSWKFFRFMIFSQLDPMERLSYIEVDWEPRRTNKLR